MRTALMFSMFERQMSSLNMIPIALVAAIQRVGENVKAFNPASFLTLSNSRGV